MPSPIMFGSWEPDSYLLNANAVAEASGVLPQANSYGPLPQPAVTSLAAATTIRGAFAARTITNTIAIFALSATKAYKFAGVGSAWTDVTRLANGDYSVATDDYWSLKQYGTNLIAVNNANAVQYIDVDSGNNFAALSAGAPAGSRYVNVVGDFVMLGVTSTSSRQVKWSSRNDATTFTAGQRDSDSQTFPDGGDVMGIAGSEIGGLVFQTETIRRMSVRSDAAIMEFHKIDSARGTRSPYSIVADGNDTYYYSTNGFMKVAADGSSSNIGINRVNDWFRENTNISRPKAVIGVLDPTVRRIAFLAPSASNASSTTLDVLVFYDIDRDKWTHATVALTYIFPAATPGVTLTALAALYSTLSAVPYPLGSDLWKGGAPGLAAFDSANKLCFFTGTPSAASVQTTAFEPIPGARGFVRGFRLLGDAMTATGMVGGTERPQTPVVYNAPQSVNAQGRIPARISTRIAQVQVDIPSGTPWANLQGISFDDGDTAEDGKR